MRRQFGLVLLLGAACHTGDRTCFDADLLEANQADQAEAG